MTGFIYAVECGDLVKIGFGASPWERLHVLQVGSPHELKLVGYILATKMQEYELHLLCGQERVRGEWFRKGPVVSHFLSVLPKPEERPRKRAPRAPLKFPPKPGLVARAGAAA